MDEDDNWNAGPSQPRKHLNINTRTVGGNAGHPYNGPRQAQPTMGKPGFTRQGNQGMRVNITPGLIAKPERRNPSSDVRHPQRYTNVIREPSRSKSHLNTAITTEGGNRRHLGQGSRLPQRTLGDPDAQGTIQNRKSNFNSNYKYRVRNQYQNMGFCILERIADSKISEIFLTLNEHKAGFMDLLNSPIYRFDMIVLIFQILSKVSQSPFDAMKSKMFLDICNSNFISCLRNYLTDLPYTVNKSQNNMYWNNQNQFWKNLITFCEDVLNISPTTAIRTCRALIESVSKTCLEYLNKRHAFMLLEEDALRFEELRNKLINYADKPQTTINRNVNTDVLVSDGEVQPPDDFRELSVIPTREDLLDAQPFLRPNIVNGAYSDVEHYLDVQFRLLREDCFGPIRVGVSQFQSNPTKRKYDHIRILRNVKFVGPYISNFKKGTLVQMDIENNKYLKKINWTHSKRLIYGSLVLFTKDNFSNVIIATILERNPILLSTGKFAVSLVDTSFSSDFRDGAAYTMIESEVYFEPYLHVLKALQAPSFPEQLPMQQYIVKVNPSTNKPAYLDDNTQFVISNETKDEELLPELTLKDGLRNIISKLTFTVLNPGSWPTYDELKFNESQYEAYKLALTHEFAVIQGPPGTGKTYVGLNIAKALLQNIKSDDQCLMLVICYTNHALDQFLVEISKVTRKIVRIGGQSRNKDVEQFNLVNLRKTQSKFVSKVNNYYAEVRNALKGSIQDLQESMLLLDILNHGVICHEYIDDVPQVQLLCKYYEEHFPSVKYPLMHWLFENSAEYYSDFDTCLLEYENLLIDNQDNEYNNMRTDYNVILDEDKKSNVEKNRQMASFMLTDSKLELKKLVGDYNTSQNYKTQMEIANLNSKINLFSDMIKHRSREIALNITERTNFSRIATEVRWRLYFTWISKIEKVTQKMIADYENVVSPLIENYEEARMVMDMELLKNQSIKVLGLTTSGAARMRKLLNAVSPKIVIVEEAAEVLEQHIITSLTESCQHLILIGDHQQLRPSAAYLKLARQYDIEVSLFERMITNGIHSRRLSVQHRMRPEIAALISPHIYPDLENHPSVENLGDVPGLEKNVFFFTHEYREENESNDSNSRANYKEADLTLSLANYLMQQGYESHDVTILAAYSGQMFYMRKERRNYACLKDVKITVVDNYQGEESRIILLSLVRNNPDNVIGFLGTENRICVALSRAKQGFYMFGNINMLKTKSELWRKIAATLESNGSLGTVLNLKCQVHPDNLTPIVAVEDFHKVPEGGCLRKCNYKYKCGHHCLLYCHGYDRQHVKIKCLEPCERILCDLNHVCPLKCFESCGECNVYVRKTLPCGHEMDVFCHRQPEDPKNECLTKIEAILPNCEHKVQKECYLDIKKVKCPVKCKQRLDKCGHACERDCHVAYPDHDKYTCYKACARKNKGCMAKSDDDLGPHQCKKQCYEECDDCNVQVKKKRLNCKHTALVACCVNVDDTPCNKPCARSMACGHFCKKKCAEPCGDCKAMVTKVIPDCNHKIKVECQKTVSREHCTEQCERTLPCGHLCKNVCSAVCDKENCKTLVSTEVDSPCGHKVKLPCNVYAAFINGEILSKKLLEYCKSPCGKELACKHLCGGSCSECFQGRLHAPCKQTCNQINICGHQCQEPCNQICPPCNMACEVQCQHSRCGRKCGELCVKCKEKCSRSCPHGSCTRLCSEECSRAACAAACKLTLACGHRCRGVCGETCPPVCRICSPDTFPTDFLGDEYGEDEMFILLEDCGHVLELENMENLMTGNQEDIKIRQCPYCRKPIINTKRYKDLVNQMFKNDINVIKKRVYGANTEITMKLKELLTKVNSLYSTIEHNSLSTSLYNLIVFLRRRKKMYLLQVEMLLIYYDIIEMVTECWKKFQKINYSVLEEELEEHIRIILKVLKIDLKSKIPIKISEQLQKDIGNEIKRLNAIVQLAELLNVWGNVSDDSNFKPFVEAAKNEVFNLFVFDEEKAIEAMTSLKVKAKSSVIISKLEREMIVKAVGLKAGRWFKCQNGHYYCIDACGGAMEIGKCPDCGDMVGGAHHKLLPSNSHAPEMDGSKYPAYSVEANNMANFIFDF